MSTPEPITIKSFYDSVSEQFAEVTRLSLSDNLFKGIFRGTIPGTHHYRVLDVGTSAGLCAITLAQMGHDVVAIDNAPGMVREAQRLSEEFGVKVDVRLMDATYPDFPNGSFDLIVAQDVLNDIEKAALALSSWSNLLKPKGMIIIISGNYGKFQVDSDYLAKDQYIKMATGKHEWELTPYCSEIDYTPIGSLVAGHDYFAKNHPGWDVQLLLELGFEQISVSPLDSIGYKRLCEYGYKHIVTRFLITGRKSANSNPVNRFELISRQSESAPEDGRLYEILDSLTNIHRARILNLLIRSPQNVKAIASGIGLKQNSVLYHLKILKNAGLVKTKSKGRSTEYSLCDPLLIINLFETVGCLLE